jgi:hypothetical protein
VSGTGYFCVVLPGPLSIILRSVRGVVPHGDSILTLAIADAAVHV